MVRLCIMILIMLLVLGCGSGTITPAAFSPTTIISIVTPIVPTLIASNVYFVSTNGNDANPGTLTQPWLTIQKAVKIADAGDMIYVRGGEYKTIFGGWSFQNSGKQANSISLSNYPGEQVVIKISQLSGNYPAFRCWIAPNDPPSWQTTYAIYIRILGTDVTSRALTNGILSQKGIVIQGMQGEQIYAINGAGCDNWEIAGVDFIEVAAGIRTFKMPDSPDNWYVHNNRVYNYYRESGMQFNGNDNVIENNEIYKVSNELYTPYGCQMLNFLGHGNIISGNTLSRKGSTAICGGILFEWDLADKNTVERNLIFDVPFGIAFEGGDNNLIRNNLIYNTGKPEPHRAGIEIMSYDNQATWPCNDVTVNDPADPDYQYYYKPRNCHSSGNQIYNNTIHGFAEGLRFYPLAGENTIVRNNVFSGWTRGAICYYNAGQRVCSSLPAGLIADHNADHGLLGFADFQHFDFHLTTNSPLIDAGYDLGSLNPDDFDGNSRPQGTGFDIGAYEFLEP